MPSYKTRENKSKKRRTRKYERRLPRDPHKLFRWAARGSPKDYEKLRNLARRARNSRPAHIDAEAYETLEYCDRLRMIEQIQAAEQHDVSAGMFFDALNWLFDKIPWGNWLWPVSAAQSTINSQKGDALNEVDEQYARLVGATYGSVEERPYVIDHWKRQPQFDSSYISVWDNPDGHRLICVRGTQGAADIGQDILIGITGSSTNLIGEELLQIIAATDSGTTVDLAAHSLGTSLALEAYTNPTVYKKIHETYLYNPAYSPFLRGKTDAYERDESVRFFINVKDIVSMGGSAHKAPRNVVYKSRGDVVSAHKLAQWQGSSAYQDPIYHAPPETKVHAAKQALQLTKHEGDDEEIINADIDADNTSNLPMQGRSNDVVAFDFGAEDYDFGVL